MIQLPLVQPTQAVLDKLAEYQAEIDELPDFSTRSEAAKTKFESRNKKGQATFDEVKVALTLMCSGARRCVYCEDSEANQVEHIYPKSLYPHRTFDWSNYVYACSGCNGPKNNQFAIFRHDTGAFYRVNPPKGQPITEPPSGNSVMINPRTENPLDYCLLDIGPRATFKFFIIKPLDTPDYQRADYTFNEILNINGIGRREVLRQARKEAYGDYKDRLGGYIRHRDKGSPDEQLAEIIEQIQKKGHPTVWKEMQRYYLRGFLKQRDPDLHSLFEQALEALHW